MHKLPGLLDSREIPLESHEFKKPALLTCLEAGSNCSFVGDKSFEQVTRVIKFKGDTIIPRVCRKQRS